MKHLNGNLMCAIDIETSGLMPPFTGAARPHDMLQIAIVPVAANLTVSREFPLFHLKLQPKRPENVDAKADEVNRGMLRDAMLNGMEPWTAVERFEEWFTRLRLAPGKKIVVLGCNYANFDKYFIMDWLGGPLNYNEFFRSDVRDVQTVACYINDTADHFSEMIPFPKWRLSYLASCLGVDHPHATAHDAVQDCVTSIEVYRRLLRYRDYYNVPKVLS